MDTAASAVNVTMVISARSSSMPAPPTLARMGHLAPTQVTASSRAPVCRGTPAPSVRRRSLSVPATPARMGALAEIWSIAMPASV